MAQFRAALREQLERPDDRLSSVHLALMSLAAAVRDSGEQAEHLVILVKHEWDSAVNEFADGDSATHQQLRQALVTSAIKAYYLQ